MLDELLQHGYALVKIALLLEQNECIVMQHFWADIGMLQIDRHLFHHSLQVRQRLLILLHLIQTHANIASCQLAIRIDIQRFTQQTQGFGILSFREIKIAGIVEGIGIAIIDRQHFIRKLNRFLHFAQSIIRGTDTFIRLALLFRRKCVARRNLKIAQRCSIVVFLVEQKIAIFNVNHPIAVRAIQRKRSLKIFLRFLTVIALKMKTRNRNNHRRFVRVFELIFFEIFERSVIVTQLIVTRRDDTLQVATMNLCIAHIEKTFQRQFVIVEIVEINRRHMMQALTAPMFLQFTLVRETQLIIFQRQTIRRLRRRAMTATHILRVLLIAECQLHRHMLLQQLLVVAQTLKHAQRLLKIMLRKVEISANLFQVTRRINLELK
mmetsp:Transcript_11049/g.16715  ORF Transcript_11049/g.16715 Transcript_11049/m.16715 type:complete len:379 (-) Transcript_11049:1000-2136(-)